MKKIHGGGLSSLVRARFFAGAHTMGKGEDAGDVSPDAPTASSKADEKTDRLEADEFKTMIKKTKRSKPARERFSEKVSGPPHQGLPSSREAVAPPTQTKPAAPPETGPIVGPTNKITPTTAR